MDGVVVADENTVPAAGVHAFSIKVTAGAVGDTATFRFGLGASAVATGSVTVYEPMLALSPYVLPYAATGVGATVAIASTAGTGAGNGLAVIDDYIIHESSGDGAIANDAYGNGGTIINGILDLSRLTYTPYTNAVMESVGVDNIYVISTAATANARAKSSDFAVVNGNTYTLHFTVENLSAESAMYISVNDSIGILRQSQVAENTPSVITFTARTNAIYFWFYATATAVSGGRTRYYDMRLLEGSYPSVKTGAFTSGNSITWATEKTDIDAAFAASGIPHSYNSIIPISALSENYNNQIFFDFNGGRVLIANRPLAGSSFEMVKKWVGGFGDYESMSSVVDGLEITVPNSTGLLNIVNSYGDKSNIHAKLLSFDTQWNGYKYWLTYSPYPNEAKENPCIAVSNDLISWSVPAGLVNPIEPAPTNPAMYNSDPHLLYRSDIDTIELWWRVGGSERPLLIRRKTSADGVVWSDAETVLSMAADDFLSPSVLFDNGVYRMWGVDASSPKRKVVYLESTEATTWNSRSYPVIDWGPLTPWHLDVILTDLGYELLVQAYDSGLDNNHADLYWVVMDKGMGRCTTPKLALHRSGSIENQDYEGIYRSTFIKSGNEYTIIYTGQNTSLVPTRALMMTQGLLMLDDAEYSLTNNAFTAAAWVYIAAASAEIAADTNILAFSNAVTGGIYAASGGIFKATDGTNTATVTVAGGWARGETPLICLRTNGAGTQMQVGYKKAAESTITWGAAANYDGSFGPGTHMRWGYTSGAPFGAIQSQLWAESVATDAEILSLLRYAL